MINNNKCKIFFNLRNYVISIKFVFAKLQLFILFFFQLIVLLACHSTYNNKFNRAMKLALTFQPSVKAQYKKICIQRIKQTVAQIKEYFKYQKDVDQIVQSNKTRTKLSLPKQKCMFGIDSNELHQSEQLIKNFKNVQTNLSYQTSLYQNILQKLKLMNQKQQNLQKLVKQLGKLKENTISKDETQILQKINFSHDSLKTDQSKITVFSQVQTFTSPTFRANNNSLEKDQRFFRNITNDYQQNKQTDKTKSKQHFKLNNHIFNQNNQKLTKKYLSTNNRKDNFRQSIISQKNNSITTSDCVSNSSTIKNSQQTSFSNIFLSSNEINQTAEFLVSFMKLEKQFSTIKKKNIFQQSNYKDLDLSKQKPSYTIFDNKSLLLNTHTQQTVK